MNNQFEYKKAMKAMQAAEDESDTLWLFALVRKVLEFSERDMRTETAKALSQTVLSPNAIPFKSGK